MVPINNKGASGYHFLKSSKREEYKKSDGGDYEKGFSTDPSAKATTGAMGNGETKEGAK